jgi:hypothetical protein
MNAAVRKDSIASAAVLLAILVSALCGVFAIDVQATTESNLGNQATGPVCESHAGASAFTIGRIAL